MRRHRDLLIDLNLLFIAIIACSVVLVIGYRVIHVLFPVLILLLSAMLLAFLLDPLVSRLQAAGVRRGPAVLLVYLGVLALIFGLGGLLTVPLAHQISSLTKRMPHDRKQLVHLVGQADLWLAQHSIPVHLESLQQEGLKSAQSFGQKLLGDTLNIVQTVSRIIIDVLAIIVISLYLLIDGPRIRHNALRIVPARQRNNVLFVEATVRSVVGSYVRGQLLLALIVGLMASAGCFILGVHFPLVIGLAAGFFELIPMLGPILGAIPAIGIAAFQGWQLAVATVVLFVIIQQLEAHVIAPRIMGRAVGVHPIVAILAVLLGAELRGVFGALVAVPLAGIGYVLAQAFYSYLTGQVQMVTVVRRPPLYVRLYRRVWGSAAETESGAEETVTVTVEAPSDQLAGIVHERDVLAEQFERTEREAHQLDGGEEEGDSVAVPPEPAPTGGEWTGE
jgi:predicted PurR-regulated permease PerM